MKTWLTVLCILAAHAVRGVNVYVAVDGNDTWDGKAPNRAGDNGPKATLTGAIEAVRAARRAQPNLPEEVRIEVRGGTYELAEPIQIRPEDSGADANAPFVIRAYQNEKPVLSGGKQITGWKKIDGKPGWWQAEIPDVLEGKWYFRSLFIDGKRKQRARTPNEGFFRIQGESPQDKPVKLKFKPGEIKKEWTQSDVEVIALLAWSDFRMFIRDVDESNHVATLSRNPTASNRESNARYYIENAPDALDAPGEWYLNRKTGLLTYIGQPAEDLNKANVVASRLDDLLVLQGEKDRPVRNVAFRELTFSHTDWTLETNGYADSQAAIAIRGDVRAEFAVNCAIEDCSFTHLAGYALELGRGCQNWKVVGNEMSDLGAGGVRIGETSKRSEAAEMNHSHVITDNQIHDTGLVYPPAVGVLILQSGTNRLAHNHIHHLYYTAVSVGWNWGYQETPCRGNIIEFNHLHDVGQGMLSDMGAVYTLGIQKGTAVRNNLIHDVNSFTYGGWGLYPDEGSSEIIWENNVVYRTKSAGFHQHYGRENIVRNNIFAFGKEYQLMRSREEEHTSFIFTNNIVYFDSGSLLGSYWKNDHFRMERNLYFDARPGATPDAMKFVDASLEQWRARGHDTNSVIVDPKFRDPQKYDFTLAPDSPALKLGFKPIDLATVGVRKSRQQ